MAHWEREKEKEGGERRSVYNLHSHPPATDGDQKRRLQLIYEASSLWERKIKIGRWDRFGFSLLNILNDNEGQKIKSIKESVLKKLIDVWWWRLQL